MVVDDSRYLGNDNTHTRGQVYSVERARELVDDKPLRTSNLVSIDHFELFKGLVRVALNGIYYNARLKK